MRLKLFFMLLVWRYVELYVEIVMVFCVCLLLLKCLIGMLNLVLSLCIYWFCKLMVGMMMSVGIEWVIIVVIVSIVLFVLVGSFMMFVVFVLSYVLRVVCW